MMIKKLLKYTGAIFLLRKLLDMYDTYQEKRIRKQLLASGWEIHYGYWINSDAKMMWSDELVYSQKMEEEEYYAYVVADGWKVYTPTKQNKDILNTIINQYTDLNEPKQIVYMYLDKNSPLE